jgi:hypothetical protein
MLLQNLFLSFFNHVPVSARFHIHIHHILHFGMFVESHTPHVMCCVTGLET